MAVANSSSDTSEYFEWHVRQLYHVNSAQLPKKWNPKDKYTNLRLTNNNLRVSYNGPGKSHKEAGSVRADNPIPAACGIYYFEVTIINRGRDGFFGIGVAKDSVNLNRLPGWDHGSFGYHADDGHAFNASASGQPYGPVFTTGDIVGCGINFLDNSCFYTKNGVCLGTAFTDIPSNIHPVVGLQTAGEELEANFGQKPFMYDIRGHIQEARATLAREAMLSRLTAEEMRNGDWQVTMQRLVCSYLVHRGFSASAESFSSQTQQPMEEDLQSIRHRQRILRLVNSGRLGEAIETTERLYPGLLADRPHLLFQLKCRQFVEMVAGADSEVRNVCSSTTLKSMRRSTQSPDNSPLRATKIGILQQQSPSAVSVGVSSSSATHSPFDVEMLIANNGSGDTNGHSTNGHQRLETEDYKNGLSVDGITVAMTEDMDCSESQHSTSDLENSSALLMERILAFGRDLHALSVQLRRQRLYEKRQRSQLREAFSLLAYSSPVSSPVGHLLHPSQREQVANALNSAILDSQHLPQAPALEVNLAHAHRNLSTLASSANCGAIAFLQLKNVGDVSIQEGSKPPKH